MSLTKPSSFVIGWVCVANNLSTDKIRGGPMMVRDICCISSNGLDPLTLFGRLAQNRVMAA